jgi:hypothetical protein
MRLQESGVYRKAMWIREMVWDIFTKWDSFIKSIGPTTNRVMESGAERDTNDS